MKKLTITRGSASYETRGLDTIFEREQAIQEDCLAGIQAMVQEVDSKAQAQHIAKQMMVIAAAVHSDLERILRNHGKEEEKGDTVNGRRHLCWNIDGVVCAATTAAITTPSNCTPACHMARINTNLRDSSGMGRSRWRDQLGKWRVIK